MVTDKDFEVYETLVAYSKSNKDFKLRFELSEAFSEQKNLDGYRRAAEVLRDTSSDMVLPSDVSKALTIYIEGLDSWYGTLQSSEALKLYSWGYKERARTHALEALKHINKDSFAISDFKSVRNDLEEIIRQ